MIDEIYEKLIKKSVLRIRNRNEKRKYFGFGSAKRESYGSYGFSSGSATLSL